MLYSLDRGAWGYWVTASRETGTIRGRRLALIFDSGRNRTMDGHARITRVDANRGLRDRLGHDRAGGTSVQDAELTLAVSDLQDLARHRSTTRPDDHED